MTNKNQIKAMFFNDSNKMQTYSTHSLFRYFGKLPPTLVKRILEENLPKGKGNVLELMCGSGTSLLESLLSGRQSVGIDVNPLSVLISKVKTTYIDKTSLLKFIDEVNEFIVLNYENPECLNYFRPKTINLDNWFTATIQEKLSLIKYMIDHASFLSERSDDAKKEDLKNLLLVSYASIIRKSSNASPKTGRIFRMSEDTIVDPYKLLTKKLNDYVDRISALPEIPKPEVYLKDARETGLKDNHFDLIINHPPYFALYKYSSDVMRFELEWCDFNRKDIAKNEIEDGFKTTKVELLENYIADMQDVFKEAKRVLKKSGKICVVVSDSTLREEQLPVVKKIIESANNVGLVLEDHYLREVAFTQASYHKSANPNIKTNEDHLMYFKKSDCL